MENFFNENFTIPPLRPRVDRDGGGNEGAAIGWGVDPETPPERGDAVTKARESTTFGPCAADSVVTYLQLQRARVDSPVDDDVVGAGVFDHVRECFGHDEVRGRLDGRGQPVQRDVSLYFDREPGRERVHASAEPPVSED
jgi:hypothetical protein